MASASATRVVAILVFLSAVSLPGALADADFIAQTCKSADNEQCVAVLSADPRSANATTVRDLASIAMDIALSNADDSFNKVHDAYMKSRDDSQMKALYLCLGIYSDGFTDLRHAQENLASGDLSAAEDLAASAEDVGDECEKTFADNGAPSDVVAAIDRRMKDLCGLAGDLINASSFSRDQ